MDRVISSLLRGYSDHEKVSWSLNFEKDLKSTLGKTLRQSTDLHSNSSQLTRSYHYLQIILIVRKSHDHETLRKALRKSTDLHSNRSQLTSPSHHYLQIILIMRKSHDHETLRKTLRKPTDLHPNRFQLTRPFHHYLQIILIMRKSRLIWERPWEILLTSTLIAPNW